MIFGEWIYAIFLAAAALVFRFAPARLRPWWLATCGLGFYAYYSPAFVWLLAGEIVIIMLLASRTRRDVFAYSLALIVSIGVLVAYKYWGLLNSTFSGVAASAGVGRVPAFPQLVLPLAISFFTFEFVHYVVDERKGTLGPHRPADFLAFALFFPTMVAGPIKRFQDFHPQIASARAGAADVNAGVTRIAVGFAKKIVVADSMVPLTLPLLTDAAARGASPGRLLIALLAFSIKIYMDFSGYSDIAIGSARLFGIHVPENFSWPYLRRNIAQFWRHWHMSLTSWITDYVYKPLGGNRRGLALTAVNVIAAMAVSGMWHGAQWHFLAWGLYNGVLLAGFRIWEALVKKPALQRLPALKALPLALVGASAGAALTFVAVTIGWGLFAMPIDRFAMVLGRLL